MTGKLNNAQNSTVIKRKKNQPNPQKYTNSVKASSVSWTSRVKPNLTIYDKLGLLCKNKSGTVFDDQLLVGGKWEKEIYSLPFPSSYSHSHFYSHETSLAIPIPMGIPWDPRDPWEFPIYKLTQLLISASDTLTCETRCQ